LNKWKEGFLEHGSPNDPNSFPFVVLGNKVDKESDRKVSRASAEEWC
jgi:Ras-related protein Rab-7A